MEERPAQGGALPQVFSSHAMIFLAQSDPWRSFDSQSYDKKVCPICGMHHNPKQPCPIPVPESEFYGLTLVSICVAILIWRRTRECNGRKE